MLIQRNNPICTNTLLPVIFIFIFGVFNGQLFAQPQIKKDSSIVQVVKIPSEVLENYKQNEDFFYDRIQEMSGPSWQLYIQNLFNRLIYYLFYRENSSIWTVLFYVIIFSFVIYLAYKLLKSKMSAAMYSDSFGEIPDIGENLENIRDINPEELIKKALNNKEYRIAIRILYLKILRNLSDKNLIIWKPEKTNREYLYEIKSNSIKEPFERVIKIFEYIWYGNTSYNDEMLLEFVNTFEKFDNMIDRKK